MKGSFVFVAVVALLTPCLCIRSPNSSSRKSNAGFLQVAKSGPNSVCSSCVDLSGQLINELLNVILNVGVVGGCETLCAYLPNQLEQVVCNLACDYFGFEEFVKLIKKADIDPIYICEIIKTCPIFDGGDCKITQLDVTPKSGPQGEFDIGLTYVSKNGTGTGELDIEIRTVDGIPVGDNFLQEMESAGTYPVNIKLKAVPDPDCDPTQGFCEEWLPGNYTVKIAICNGECGSKHPHSQIYDEAETFFTITG